MLRFKVRLLLTLVWSVVFTCSVSADDVVVKPRPKPGALDNPLKGWCPYPNAGTIHQPYSMVFQYISWRELEPVAGDFRFEEWEKQWNDKASAGKHVVFRVYVDYPKKPSGLPDWLRRAGVRETAYTDYGGGRSPNYNDPRMIAGMERLIAALGKRYNNNPRVAFIQLGLLGFWGEWHTYPRTELYASPETERRIIQSYQKAFPDKSLMARYAQGPAGNQDWIGFHDDMFPEDTDNGQDWSFLARIRKAKRIENWKGAVIGGEMVPFKAEHWLGNGFNTTVTMLNRSHFTWVGPYCPALEKSANQQFVTRSQQLVRRMGYDFQITELVHPAQVKGNQLARISLKGKNLGVAPFYYPWSVEWALMDSMGKVVKRFTTNWDIRTWTPGVFEENQTTAFNVPAGKYYLGLGIRDPWMDRPTIQFANDLPFYNGWTVISNLEIIP